MCMGMLGGMSMDAGSPRRETLREGETVKWFVGVTSVDARDNM